MITDLETFMLDEGFDRIFRMLEKRGHGDWTPLEMSEKYIDQDHYVDSHYTFIKIVEVIELPDKDVLIGYKTFCDWGELDEEEYSKLPIHYRKLSQIELSYFPDDMNEENW